MIIHEFETSAESRNDVFYLNPLGDVHAGVKSCDEEALKKTVEDIRIKPNVYWLGMGDYCDYINYTDKRFDPCNLADWAATHLDKLYLTQTEYMIDLFYPIRHQCIGLLEGNHEETIRLRYHYNVVDEMAKQLGVANLSYVCLIKWRFKRITSGEHCAVKTLTIYATHGFGAGRYAGGKVNNIINIGKDFEADIYLAGHTHEKIAVDRDRLFVPHSGSPRLLARRQIYAITGTFYKTYEVGTRSYGEKRGYPPTPIGGVKIYIEPFRKETINGEEVEMPIHLHISE